MRILVPRGGVWGDRVARLIEASGAEPVIVPLLDFVPPVDINALRSALDALATGAFDWLVVTSATTVGVLETVSEKTRIAAVGVSTKAALIESGYRVDFVPQRNSSRGMASELPEPRGRVLVLQSAAANPGLAIDLGAERVDAYRPVELEADGSARSQVAAGAIDVILVTSGAIARIIVQQFPDRASTMAYACIGPETAAAARDAGLPVDIVAPSPTMDALVNATLRRT